MSGRQSLREFAAIRLSTPFQSLPLQFLIGGFWPNVDWQALSDDDLQTDLLASRLGMRKA